MDPRVQKEVTRLLLPRSGDEVHEFRWAHEVELLKIIRYGEVERIAGTLQEHQAAYEQTIPDVHLGKDDRESALFQLISAVTLFSRAAIEGGVPENMAYTMMEGYIRCARKYGEDFFLDALRTFTETVRRYQEAFKDPPFSREVKFFISEHLNTPITVERIARHLSVSKSRCAHLFKEETGTTIHKYLEEVRIDRACHMLMFSEMEISALSEYLCYSSPSHFAAVFRKHKHMSPVAYRYANRKLAILNSADAGGQTEKAYTKQAPLTES